MLKKIQARLEGSRFNSFARYIIRTARYTGIRDMEPHPSVVLLTVQVNSLAVYGSIRSKIRESRGMIAILPIFVLSFLFSQVSATSHTLPR